MANDFNRGGGGVILYTRTVPTVPGAYWYRLTSDDGTKWEACTNLVRCPHGLYMPYRNECAHELSTRTDVEWAGPLQGPPK